MKCFCIILLSFVVRSAWSVSSVDADLIDEYGVVPNNVKMLRDDWDVNPSELDKDTFNFKGQNRNTTKWDEVDPLVWFDLNTWKKNRTIKDNDENWKQKFRETNHFEKIGKVIKCIGRCSMYRSSKPNAIEYNSNIFEGDEILTGKDSALWLLLIDGSLVRLSSKTSISLMEVNISKDEILTVSRLNYGHMHFESRRDGEYIEVNKPETDLAFLPLMQKKANREYYMIKEYREMDEFDQLAYSVVKNPGYVQQYKALNQLIQENNKFAETKKHKFFIYTPNLTIQGESASFDLYYAINSKALIYAANTLNDFVEVSGINKSIQMTLRGYKDYKKVDLQLGKWLEVDADGKEVSETTEKVNILEAGKNFTKRIPTLLLAREIWLKEIFKDVYNTNKTFKEYAQTTGYRLWNTLKENELNQRIKYLYEFTRRVETTNLDMMDKIFGKEREVSIGIDEIEYVMNKHYFAVRNRYSKKNKMVREMSDTQYSLWVLRYGR